LSQKKETYLESIVLVDDVHLKPPTHPPSQTQKNKNKKRKSHQHIKKKEGKKGNSPSLQESSILVWYGSTLCRVCGRIVLLFIGQRIYLPAMIYVL